jgi:ribonuclease HII
MKVIYVDEVGCSPIAGPVVICAVALADNEYKVPGVRDSKKLSRTQRDNLFTQLSKLEHEYGYADVNLIKELNVFWAKFHAMKVAIEKLLARGIRANKVIVDGNFTIKDLDMEQEAVIKADDKFWQVGAASILAKVTRDNMMEEFGRQEVYSHYDWANNAAYPAPKHRIGVTLFGPTDLHRTTFAVYQYYMFHYEECQRFRAEGKTSEEYFKWVDSVKDGKNTLSNLVRWKDGEFNGWR